MGTIQMHPASLTRDIRVLCARSGSDKALANASGSAVIAAACEYRLDRFVTQSAFGGRQFDSRHAAQNSLHKRQNVSYYSTIKSSRHDVTSYYTAGIRTMLDLPITRRAALLSTFLAIPTVAVAGEKIYQRKGDGPMPANMIRAVQAKLTQRGFDAGPADGLMGPRTRTAIRNFQSSEAMQVTGAVDRSLLVALGLRRAR